MTTEEVRTPLILRRVEEAYVNGSPFVLGTCVLQWNGLTSRLRANGLFGNVHSLLTVSLDDAVTVKQARKAHIARVAPGVS